MPPTPPPPAGHQGSKVSHAAALLLALVLQSSCSVVLPMFGYPPHAMRSEPPPHIDRKAETVGAPAPEFELATTHGRFKLSKSTPPVALFFFRGHWCPYCRKQLSDLSNHIGAFDEMNVRLLGISADPMDETHALKKRLSLRFHLASDEQLRATTLLGVLDGENEIPWPALFVIKEGRITYRWVATDKAKRMSSEDMLAEIRSAM